MEADEVVCIHGGARSRSLTRRGCELQERVGEEEELEPITNQRNTRSFEEYVFRIIR